MVNRAWYFASQDCRLQKDIVYSLPTLSTSLETIRVLGTKQTPNLILSNLDGSSLSKEVIKHIVHYLGPHLEHISLCSSSITESAFLSLISYCHSLQKLDLSGCNSLFMSGTLLEKPKDTFRTRKALLNLQELNLSNLRYLSDRTFNRLTGCSPMLKELSLAGCLVTFEFDPYHGSVISDSSAVLSLRNLIKFLKERAVSLKALDLSRTGITSEALKSVAQVNGLCLEKLVLQNCKEISDDAIGILCKSQPGLINLDLSGCSELTGKSVVAISANLQELRHLKLGRLRRLTDDVLAGLAELKELQSLDVSDCHQICGSELVKCFSFSESKMVHLSFSGCSLLKDSTVFSLAKLFGTSLRLLDLTSCLSITDISIRAIIFYLNNLTVLRLGWCKEITDWGLLGMQDPNEEHCPETKDDLGPKFSRNFGNMGFFTPPTYFDDRPVMITKLEDLLINGEKHGPTLRALRHLQELDLTACRKLTDISLQQVIQLPNLKKLSLGMVNEITDRTLVSVATHCRSLEHLSVNHCCFLTDEGMIQTLQTVGRLVSLDISCCDGISDRTLAAIAENCKWLKNLDVSMCNGITVARVELLQSQIPWATNIKTRFVGGADLSISL
ncbi:leucine-rich repeat-containing protein 29 isoform X2 [Protopterus annectens]|nr:leucine-rich repeat-containing protein 29 isoform X2 [Protopterus annectens]